MAPVRRLYTVNEPTNRDFSLGNTNNSYFGHFYVDFRWSIMETH